MSARRKPTVGDTFFWPSDTFFLPNSINTDRLSRLSVETIVAISGDTVTLLGYYRHHDDRVITKVTVLSYEAVAAWFTEDDLIYARVEQ